MSETPTNPSTASEPARPAIPVRRRLASAAMLALLLAGIAGAGWGGWYWWNHRDVPLAVGNDFTADPAPNFARFAGRGGAAAGRGQPADDVTVSPGRVVAVRAGVITINAVGRADNNWRLTVNRRGGAGARPATQDQELLRYQERLVEQRNLPNGVTEAQRSTLAALGTHPPELTEPQATRAIELCRLLTSKPATDPAVAPAKKELIEIAQAVAKLDANAVVAAYKKRADAIRATLPPQQLQRVLAPQQRPANTAAPAAASRPANNGGNNNRPANNNRPNRPAASQPAR